MPTKKTRRALLVLIAFVGLFQAAAPAWALVENNSVGSGQIIDRAVQAVDIAKGAIKAAKLANGAVTTAKIKNGAVTSAKIANSTIINADIAAGAAIAASKINRAGLNADLLDGKHAADFVQKTGDSTVSGNLTVTGLNFSAPKTGVISLPAYAFTAGSTTGTIIRTANYIYINGGGLTSFGAPVHLPQGATITGLTYHFRDTTGAYATSISLVKTNAAGSISYLSYMAQISSDDTTANWHTLTNNSIAFNEPVDNNIYGYSVVASLDGGAGSGTILSKVDVHYTYTSP